MMKLRREERGDTNRKTKKKKKIEREIERIERG
jgi:hypothetical protein